MYYIHSQSNHPPVIKKRLPFMVSNRLSQLSCNQEEFAKAIPEYEGAMRKSEYSGWLQYIIIPDSGKRIRKRNIVWFNSPYSEHVNTDILDEFPSHCTNQQLPQRDGVVPDPVWIGSKWLLAFPRVPGTPGTPLHFSLCCPLNDRRRAAHSFFKIGCLFSLFLFSCPSLARLRLLILLLLLISGNVHPNPGPIFPCSVCAGNVTWPGKSVQCCTCSKWVYLRCS